MQPSFPPLTVCQQDIKSLIPHPRNARTHSRQQIRRIASSIEAFGHNNPILIDRSNRIIAGHARVEAAKLLGMSSIPAIRLEHLNDDQLRAYLLADNKLAEKAGWDREVLAVELQYFLDSDLGLDVGLTGFDVPEIDLILGQVTPVPDNDDQLPRADPGPPVSRAGDMWELGKHRLLCGNAVSENDFSTLMKGRRADLVFVDPPYNVRIDGHAVGNGAIKHREFAMASGEMSAVEFQAFLTTALCLLARYSTGASTHFVCMDWRHVGELLAAGQPTFGAPANLCVWVKSNGGMGSLYRSRHELVLVFRKGKGPHQNNVQLGQYGRNRTNVWEYPGVNTPARAGDEGNLLALHPTVKPVALVADAILDCSARGDLVLDSFLGSGTTLMAAQRVGRTCYGMEMDPVYVDTAIRRWQAQTGDVAVHASTGRRFNEIAATLEARNGKENVS